MCVCVLLRVLFVIGNGIEIRVRNLCGTQVQHVVVCVCVSLSEVGVEVGR